MYGNSAETADLGVRLLGMYRFSAVDVSELHTWLQVRRTRTPAIRINLM